ncbi:MAG: 50S ribosomal protein L10, partial [Candidatus Methanomethylicia archaeon]
MLKTSIKKQPKSVRKQRILEELIQLIRSNEILAIASIRGLRTQQLQEIRKILRERGIHLKIAKNSLFKKALEKCEKKLENIEKLEAQLSDQNAFIFLNENPFTIITLLEKNKVYTEAKAGDIAQNDIIVPAGNTGMTPGPIISKLNALKIPIKIEEGSIWITKDTVVAKIGDVISQDLADILKRLNIKPIEVKLKLKSIYYKGRVLTGEELKLNIEEYRTSIINAVRSAFKLSIEAVIPTHETMQLIIMKATKIANKIAEETVIPIPELMPKAIASANTKAIILAQKLMQINPDIKIEGIQSATVASSTETKT